MIPKKSKPAQAKLRANPVKKQKLPKKPKTKKSSKVTASLKRSPKPTPTEVAPIRTMVLEVPTKTAGS